MSYVSYYIANKCHEKITNMIDSWEKHYYSSGEIVFVPPPTANTKGSYVYESTIKPTLQVQYDFINSQEYKNIAMIVQNTPFLYRFKYDYLFNRFRPSCQIILPAVPPMFQINAINF